MSTELKLAVNEVAEQVAREYGPQPGVVGAALPISADMVLVVAKGLLEAVATNYGDAAADLILSQKDIITKVIGPASLEALDKVIHGLQGGS